MKGPVISIIMPAFNQARFISRAIESILSQDFGRWNLIIVNDASTDETDRIVRPYLHDRRIAYGLNESTKGTYACIDMGIDYAATPYWASLPADAWYAPGAFAKLFVASQDNPQAAIVYGKYHQVDDAGSRTDPPAGRGWQPAVRKERKSDFADLLRFDCYINTAMAFVRKEIFDYYSFDTSLRATDHELMVRLAQDGAEFRFVDEDLGALRWEEGPVCDAAAAVRLRDHIEMLERFVVPANCARLKGYEDELVRLLQSKISALKRADPAAEKTVIPMLRSRMDAVMESIRGIASRPSITVPSKMRHAKFPFVSAVPSAGSRPEISIDRFMEQVVLLVEQGKNAEALALYDTHRAGYGEHPDLARFDTLIGGMRRTKSPPA
jgi:glycosyltransferase involved in cell wall biosynthesis